MLQPDQRKKLDSNIKMMLDNGASQDDVIAYANDFKNKFGNIQKKKEIQSSSSPVQKLDSSGEEAIFSDGSKFPKLDLKEKSKKQKIKSELDRTEIKQDNTENSVLSKTKIKDINSIKNQNKIDATRAKETLQDFRQKTTVPDEEKQRISEEVNNEIKGVGVFNTINNAGTKIYNYLGDKLGPIKRFVGIGDKIETDVLAAEKKQAKQSLLQQGIKPKEITEDLINDKAKEIKINNKISEKRQSLINEYMESMPESDKKMFEIDRMQNYKSISDNDKNLLKQRQMQQGIAESLADDYSSLKNKLTNNLKNGLNPSQEDIKSLENLRNQVIKQTDKLLKIDKEYTDNYSNIGTAEEEFDIAKRRYGSITNFFERLEIAGEEMAFGIVGLHDYLSTLGGNIYTPKSVLNTLQISEEKKKNEEQKNTLRKDISKVNNVEDFLDYTTDLVATQIPNLASLYFTGGTGGLSIIGGSSAGNKFQEMYYSNLEGNTKYTGTQLSVSPLVYGGAEVISELPTMKILGQGKRIFKAALSDEIGREMLRNSAMKTAKNLALEFTKNTGKEIAGEEFTNLIQNLNSIIIEGKKDVNILDNAGDVFKDSATLGFLLTSMPHAFGLITKPFQQKDQLVKLDNYTKTIIQLSEKLKDESTSDEMKSLINDRIDSINKESESIVKNTISSIDKMPIEVFNDVLKTEKESSIIRVKAQKVQEDTTLNDSERKILLDGLNLEYNNLEQKRLDLIEGRLIPEKQNVYLTNEVNKSNNTENTDQITTEDKKSPQVVKETTSDTMEQSDLIVPSISSEIISNNDQIKESNNNNDSQDNLFKKEKVNQIENEKTPSADIVSNQDIRLGNNTDLQQQEVDTVQPTTNIGENKSNVKDLNFSTERENENFYNITGRDSNGIEISNIEIEKKSDKKYVVRGSDVFNENLRDKGIGFDMYKSMIEDANQRGVEIYSDTESLSKQAEGVWKKLVNAGYAEYLGDVKVKTYTGRNTIGSYKSILNPTNNETQSKNNFIDRILDDSEISGALDWLDSLKLDNKDFKSTVPLAPQLWNAFIDSIKLSLKAGNSIANAIEEAKNILQEKGYSLDEITKAIKFLNQKKENSTIEENFFQRKKGQRSVLQRLNNNKNPKIVTDAINRIGLNYDIDNQEKIYSDAVNFVNEVGTIESYNAIKENKVTKGSTITVIYATILDRLPKEVANELSTISDFDELNKKQQEYDDLLDTILSEFSSRQTDFGQANSILNLIYNKNNELFYSLSKQIERHKSINKGEIPNEILSKLKDLSKKNEELLDKIQELEEKYNTDVAQQAFESIKEDLLRKISSNKSNIKPLSKEAKILADKVRKAKIRKPDIFRASTGVDLVWDSAIEIVAKTIETTGKVADAIQAGLEYIKKSDWYKKLDKEKQGKVDLSFIDSFSEFNEEKSQSIYITKDGDVKVPLQSVKDFITNGGTDVNELVKQLKNEIEKEFPFISEREIRDAISGYGKRSNRTKNQLSQDINKLKRIARYESELEDLQKGIVKEKNEITIRKLSDKERLLQSQIKQLKDDLGITEQERTKRSENYTKKRILQLQERIDNGDFAKKEIKPIQESLELKKLRTEKNRIQEEFDKLAYKEEIRNKNFWGRLGDLFSGAWDSLRLTRATGEVSFVGAQGGFYMIDATFSRKTLQNLYTNIKGTTASEWIKNPYKTFIKVAKSAHSAEAIIEMINKMGNKNNYETFEAELKNHPYYDVFINSKLRILGEDLKTQVRDEMFYGNAILSVLRLPAEVTTIATKGKKFTTIQGYYEKFTKGDVSDKNKKAVNEMTGPLTAIAAFERGNNVFMNLARIELFMNGVRQLELQGKNPIDHIQEYKKLASAVNTVTGSANLSQSITMFLPVLNKLIFSARYWGSAINISLSPFYFFRLGNYSDFDLKNPKTWKPNVAQKMFVRSTIKGITAFYASALAMVYFINSALDDDKEIEEEEKQSKRAYIEYDPRSANFMKVVSGNTSTDFFGPYRNQVVLYARLLSRQTKKRNGEIVNNGEKFGSKTNWDIITNFVANKAHPTLGMGIKNAMGKEVEIVDENGNTKTEVQYFEENVAISNQIKNNIYPIFYDTTQKVLEEDPVLGANLYILLSFIGKQSDVYDKNNETKKE